jgi:hypothetical protein
VRSRRRGRALVAAISLTATLPVAAAVAPVRAGTVSPSCPSGWAPDPAVRRVPWQDLTLVDVTVADRYDAWAVGSKQMVGADGTPAEPLLERWDGRAWHEVSMPGPPSGIDTLTGVAATSSDDVWTVGYNTTDHVTRAMARHFDGTGWTATDLPIATGPSDVLRAVDAAEPDDVWAVGSEWVDSWSSRAMAMRWDGDTWRRTVLDGEPLTTAFHDVAVVGPDDVWAVGYHYDGSSITQLIAHWDGAVWRRVPLRTRIGSLGGVVAVAADDVWSVGSSDGRPTLLHWDGSTWTDAPAPGLEVSGWLHDVAAASTGDVWAVGSYEDEATSDPLNLLVHWDGSAWTQSASPTRGTFFHDLHGVAASSDGEWWAVGDDHLEALTLRRCDATPISTTLTGAPVLASTSALAPRVTLAVSATLTTLEGSGVRGVELSFDLGDGVRCTARTDADGTASCEVLSSAAAVRNSGYTVTFAGDQYFRASSDTAGLIE